VFTKASKTAEPTEKHDMPSGGNFNCDCRECTIGMVSAFLNEENEVNVDPWTTWSAGQGHASDIFSAQKSSTLHEVGPSETAATNGDIEESDIVVTGANDGIKLACVVQEQRGKVLL
jgi:hypothetical protein